MNMVHELELGLLLIADQSAQSDIWAHFRSYAPTVTSAVSVATLLLTWQQLASKLEKLTLQSKSFESTLHLIGHAVVLSALLNVWNIILKFCM